MSFYLIGGIVGIFSGVILIVVYIIATKMGEERSLAAKIIIWIGMLLSMAGAAFMTVEYCYFPAPPKSIAQYFKEYYGESYKDLITFDEIIYVNHIKMNTVSNEEYKSTYFKTDIVYTVADTYKETFIINEYQYNADHTFENVVSTIMEE